MRRKLQKPIVYINGWGGHPRKVKVRSGKRDTKRYKERIIGDGMMSKLHL